MNYKNIEKSLFQITLQTCTELSLYKQSKNINPKGNVYTLYRDLDKTLLIGFTNKIKEITVLYETLGYKLVGNRHGTEIELKTLNETLNELGYRQNKNFTYYYSKNIMRYLNILGWPIGKSKPRYIKKRA